MPINRSHARYLDVLFSRAGANRYPSHHVLARIEDSITDRATAERYVDLLLDEAEQQRYPSLRMLDRVRAVAHKMAVADVLDALARQAADEESPDDD